MKKFTALNRKQRENIIGQLFWLNSESTIISKVIAINSSGYCVLYCEDGKYRKSYYNTLEPFKF